MGKSPTKELEEMQGKLDAAQAAYKRLEGENAKLQRRLHAKAQEVDAARQARREALTLMREAATDPVVRDRAIALLAADAMSEQQVAAMVAQAANQPSIPSTEGVA